jgi:hypothetical protein
VATGEVIRNGQEIFLGSSPMDASVRMLVPPVPSSRKNDGTPISIEYSLVVRTSNKCVKIYVTNEDDVSVL